MKLHKFNILVEPALIKKNNNRALPVPQGTPPPMPLSVTICIPLRITFILTSYNIDNFCLFLDFIEMELCVLASFTQNYVCDIHVIVCSIKSFILVGVQNSIV